LFQIIRRFSIVIQILTGDFLTLLIHKSCKTNRVIIPAWIISFSCKNGRLWVKTLQSCRIWRTGRHGIGRSHSGQVKRLLEDFQTSQYILLNCRSI